MNILPSTFEEAVLKLEEILTQDQVDELKKLPFVSSNIQDETDFFQLVISSFELNKKNIDLLRDIAKKNPGQPINDDFLTGDIADEKNGARLILEKLRERLI